MIARAGADSSCTLPRARRGASLFACQKPGGRAPTPLPFPASRRRRGATELCRIAILGHDRGSGPGEEKTQESTRRRHRSHASRQAFRHFGTRLILVHRSNNGWGDLLPRCSYLGLTVLPSGSQVLCESTKLFFFGDSCEVPSSASPATAASSTNSRRGMARSSSLSSTAEFVVAPVLSAENLPII